MKLTVVTLLLLGAVATGAGFVGPASVLQNRHAGKPDPRQIAAQPDEVNPKPAPGRMFVTGRVLDPPRKLSVPNASVMVRCESIHGPPNEGPEGAIVSEGARPGRKRRLGPLSSRRSAHLVVAP